MRRQFLLPLLVALLFQVSGIGAQPASKDDVLQLLKPSVEDLDDFKGVKITAVEVKPDGLIELTGQIPNSTIKPALKDLCETVLKNAVLDGTLKGGPYKVGFTGMVDLSVPAEKRLVDLLHLRLFGMGKPLQGKLTEATVSPQGVVTLQGAVLAEEMKAQLAAEGKKLLDEAVLAKTLPGPYARIDTSMLKTLPSDLFGILQASVKNAPELEGVRLVAAELKPDGVLYLAGLVADEGQKVLLRRRAVAALTEAIQGGVLPMARLETVDTANMRVGASSVDELLVLEGLLPTMANRAVRTQLYNPERGELVLAGIVEDEAAKTQAIDVLKKLPGVRNVDASKVLLRQSTDLRPGDPTGTLLGAQDALARNASEEMLRAATASIRNAAPSSAAAINAWYLRAAAHLMRGQRQDAIGDLRVAQALAEQVAGGDRFHSTLERFQGRLRLELSDLMRQGVRGVVSDK